MSLSDYAENALLNTFRNVAAQYSQVWCQLHYGSPGEDGSSSASTGHTGGDRRQCTFGAPGSGSMTTTSALTWSSMANNETISHVSLWSASVGGNCLWTGQLDQSKAVTTGDSFTIPSGSLTLTLD